MILTTESVVTEKKEKNCGCGCGEQHGGMPEGMSGMY